VDFDKIIFDAKELDPSDDRVLRSMRIRLVIGEQVFSLFMRFPKNYPSEAMTFSYGNLKNVEEK
jgi:hypothetical protein